jgi:hypothetical protein
MMAKQIDLSLLKSMIRRRNFEVILVVLETSKFRLLEPLLARETWDDERDCACVADLVRWLREHLSDDQKALLDGARADWTRRSALASRTLPSRRGSQALSLQERERASVRESHPGRGLA